MDDHSAMASPLLEEATTATREYSYYVATVSFEEARFHGLAPTTMDDDDIDDERDDRIKLKLTTLPFQDLMLCKSTSAEARTIMDSFYSYRPNVSFEEARFYYGPPVQRKARSKSMANAKRKTSCANKVLLKLAIKNSMVKKGGIEAKVAEDVFIVFKPPKRRGFDRTRFKIKPSKLGSG